MTKTAAFISTFTRQAPEGEESLADNEVRIRVNTSGEDRFGTIIDPEGIDIEGFRKNPVIFFQHATWRMPIGRAKDIDKSPEFIDMTIVFDEGDELGREVLRKVKGEFLHAASIGFMPLPGHTTRSEGVTIYQKSDLFEVSIVTIGGNRDAVVLERGAGLEEGGPLLTKLVAAVEQLSRSVDELTVPKPQNVEPESRSQAGKFNEALLSELKEKNRG